VPIEEEVCARKAKDSGIYEILGGLDVMFDNILFIALLLNSLRFSLVFHLCLPLN
jgi:hypothetical protein